MPVIFNEKNYDLYRNRFLENGLELIKQFGVKNIRVEDVSKRVGLAKGTFYTFFPSKEEFIYQIILHNREIAKKHYTLLSDSTSLLGRKEMKEFLLLLFFSENNLYTFLSDEDYAYLNARWPAEYILNPEADEKTSRWMLSKMNARPECDWKLMANYMKAISLVTIGKKNLHQDIYSETISLLVDGLLDYLFGKE